MGGILGTAIRWQCVPSSVSQGRAAATVSDVETALLLALAAENADLRGQLASAQDMLVEAAIDAGNLYARIEAVQIECEAWRAKVERLGAEGAPHRRWLTRR